MESSRLVSNSTPHDAAAETRSVRLIQTKLPKFDMFRKEADPWLNLLHLNAPTC